MKTATYLGIPPVRRLPRKADKAQPCTVPTMRPAPTRAVAESELVRTRREYKQSRASYRQIKDYLATLDPLHPSH